MSQEKPEHLVSASARPSPKLPHYTALFSLKFHILFTLLSGCPPQRAAGHLSALAALPAGATHRISFHAFHAHTTVSLDRVLLYISPQAHQLRWHAYGFLNARHSNCTASALLAKLGGSSFPKREKLTCSMMGFKLPSSFRRSPTVSLLKVFSKGVS